MRLISKGGDIIMIVEDKSGEIYTLSAVELYKVAQLFSENYWVYCRNITTIQDIKDTIDKVNDILRDNK